VSCGTGRLPDGGDKGAVLAVPLGKELCHLYIVSALDDGVEPATALTFLEQVYDTVMIQSDDPPTHCRRGHLFGPYLVHLSWEPCSCPGARNGGHRVYCCEHLVDGKRCGDVQLVPGHVGE
jgi:hypothetical protein